MPRLTVTQALLLSSAAARSDLTLLPPPETLTAGGPPLERALRSLLRRGLITSGDGRGAWKPGAPDGGAARRRVFVITPSGLGAIGIEPRADAASSAAVQPTSQDALLSDVTPTASVERGRKGRRRAC